MKLCTHCGTMAAPRHAHSGHLGFEILLWCLGIIPGLIYSLSRHTEQHPCCPACGSDDLIPLHTPAARATLRAQGIAPAQIENLCAVPATNRAWLGWALFIGAAFLFALTIALGAAGTTLSSFGLWSAFVLVLAGFIARALGH